MVTYHPYEMQNSSEPQPADSGNERFPAESRVMFKRAWTFALVGFGLYIVSFIIGSVNTLIFDEALRKGDIDLIRNNAWLSSISSIASFVALALLIASLMFVMRGLLEDADMRRSGQILFKAIPTMKWIVLVALILFIVSLPLTFSDAAMRTPNFLASYASSTAFLLLWMLPVLIAHALNKNSTGAP